MLPHLYSWEVNRQIRRLCYAGERLTPGRLRLGIARALESFRVSYYLQVASRFADT